MRELLLLGTIIFIHCVFAMLLGYAYTEKSPHWIGFVGYFWALYGFITCFAVMYLRARGK